MTMIATVTCKFCKQPCELSGCPCRYPAITDTSRDATVKRIRKALRERSGKAWSVTGGRGTAYGWLRIDAPKARLGCDEWHRYETGDDCRDCGQNRFQAGGYGAPISCPQHVCTASCYKAYITPADRIELAALLGLEKVHPQGEQVPASIGHYVEYIDRAEGRTPRRHGVQYWD